MAAIVVHAPADPTVAGRVTVYEPSANTPLYDAEPDKLVNPDLAAVAGVPWVHWKVAAGAVLPMTAQEQVLVNAPTNYPEPIGSDLVLEDVGGGVPGLPVASGKQLTGVAHSMPLAQKDRIKNNQTVYSTESRTIFPGTDKTGVPIGVTAVVNVDSGTGWFRIYDFTNAAVVAEMSFTDTVITLKDMGQLLNLSTGEAVWELQLKNATDGASTRVYAANLRLT